MIRVEDLYLSAQDGYSECENLQKRLCQIEKIGEIISVMAINNETYARIVYRLNEKK